jgi:hypothetical protein
MAVLQTVLRQRQFPLAASALTIGTAIGYVLAEKAAASNLIGLLYLLAILAGIAKTGTV